MSLTMGIGFYFSTLVVDVLQKVTGWLNDDINKGHLEHVGLEGAQTQTRASHARRKPNPGPSDACQPRSLPGDNVGK
ncbi:hypothetical protein EJ110_NYTH34967 [Nymphaea thermarum]|nr:hypothetical protein EJ110_NYTH34967 [Nymphaea thermarum]